MRALFVSLVLAGCAAAPPQVADLLVPQQRPAAQRHFDGVRADEVPPAVVSVLQDLGFHVSASEPRLGLVVATRGYQKTFGEYHWEFWQLYMQILKNTFTLRWHLPPPDPAKLVGPGGFSAAVAIAPAASGSAVRVSFHRFVSRPTGEPILVWAEELPGPEPHQKFFALLAEALARETLKKR